MSDTIPISEAREKLAELTSRVQFAGDRFYIQKHGKTVAVLMPLAEAEFLDSMEDLALGEMIEERLRESEGDPVTWSHDDVFGKSDAGADRD